MNPQTVPTAGSNVPAGLSAANSKPPFTNGFEPPQPPLSMGQNGWMQPPQIMTGQQFGNRRRITTEGGTGTTPSSRNTGESPISALGTKTFYGVNCSKLILLRIPYVAFA